MSASADLSRFVVAVDATGVHLRETLNVTHDVDAGEVVYHTRPLSWGEFEYRRLAAEREAGRGVAYAYLTRVLELMSELQRYLDRMKEVRG